MHMVHWISLGLKWSARITGLLLVGLVLLFIFGEGPPNPFQQPLRVQLEFVALFLMVVGFLLGWRWEALGGITAVGGFALFFAVELIVHGRAPGGAMPFFVVPGVLFLLSYGVRTLK